MRPSRLPFAIALTAFLFAGAVHAQTTDTFEVRVSVIDSCLIEAQDLDFGSYDPNSLVPTVGATTITATCTLLTPFNIGIDGGSTNNDVADRQMANAGNGERLGYTLSCAGLGVPACAVNWGNTPGTDTFLSVGTGLPIPVVVAGTIPASQNVTPGAFIDPTVTATIFF